jgi:hypothetical protein
MCSIIKVIESLQNLRSLPPLSEQDIDNAEKTLGLHFADEYRSYTRKFGAISANGIELTGVVSAPRLNVVNVTISERNLNKYIPNDMYVIENTGIEGILMLQNNEGEIFSIAPNSKPEKKFNSLADYLKEG